MAAATTSSPSTSSQSSPVGVHRKPIPLQGLAPEHYDWTQTVKPLESPRLRQPPVSPVRVNLQQADWAPEPSNAHIESSHPVENVVDEVVAAPSKRTSHGVDAPLPPLPGTETTLTADTWHVGHAESGAPMLGGFHEGELADLRLLANLGSIDLNATQLPADTAQSPHAGLDFGFVPQKPVDPVIKTVESTAGEPKTNGAPRKQEQNRHSRDTDTTSSTTQQQASTESSATTSASSVSGINETSDPQDPSVDASPESSIIEDGIPQNHSVPQLQYHHQAFLPRTSSMVNQDARAQSNPDLVETEGSINRHLTPASNMGRRSSIPRPQSAYSAYSDLGARGRSPGLFPGAGNARAPSAQSQSRKSPDTRPSSYGDLLNVPYPQPAPAPLTFDNSQLRNAVGTNASLLSAQKTLDMYRQNVKKTNDLSIQYSFAVFLIATAQEQGLSFDEVRKKSTPKPVRDHDSPYIENSASSPLDLVREARSILQKLSNSGYPFAQYYLADGFASGLFSKGKEDYNSAFPLFVLAAKHGHAESAFRTALCYEFGWGCRKDPAKSVQFLRIAASKRHPGAMTRLGRACLSGDLGEKRYREGVKWLKLATESADAMYNAAPYHLGCLYETGYGDDVFQDENYAAELFTQAAELGHPEANYRMGDAYEHGKLNCPRDPALSVHFYTGGAERGHAGAMMGLCAWYMVGAEPILEKDEEEAYEWARRSAELGYVKAQYAVGYFTEMGIGCRKDILEANVWYVKAADAGDDRAKQRLAVIQAAISGGTAMDVGPARNGKFKKGGPGDKDDKECIVM